MLDTNNKVIKHKIGLLNLAEKLGNVSRACKVMGLSRDTFTDTNQRLRMAELKHYLIGIVVRQITKTESNKKQRMLY